MVRSKSKQPGLETQSSAAVGLLRQAGEDEVLAVSAGQGDTAAFETLVQKYQDRVYNLLYRLSGSEMDAEDMAQETFMKAYRALGSFRQGSKFYTWLFRIAVNTGYSRGRQVARRRQHEGISLDAPSDGLGEDHRAGATLGNTVAAGDADGPGRQLEQEDLRTRVREGLEQLDPDHRAVLLLRDMDGMDYEAIAESLSISRAAVKSRLHRARLELAKVLKDLRPEGLAPSE